jgi:uncharacterized repeat protein (TIGR03803 family)
MVLKRKFRIIRGRGLATAALALGLGALGVVPAHGADTLTTLHSFCAQGGASCTDGSYPVSSLIADPAGNLFGTNQLGGAYGQGTVFEIAKSGTLTTLYSFCPQGGICTDGADPLAGLIADPAGNLFGTTVGGGAYGFGTVFELAKTTSGFANAPTVLYSFCPQGYPCTDGWGVVAGLLADPAGSLFGTTELGGANGLGTVFELAKTTNGYAETVLYSFCPRVRRTVPTGSFRSPA